MKIIGHIFFVAVCLFGQLSATSVSAADLDLGMKAPGFVLQDIDGKRVSLNTLLSDNKPHIISFFATWCKPCLKEIPKLQALKARTGVNITLVNIDSITREALKEFLVKNSVTLPVLMDADASITGENYGYYKGGRASIPRLVILSGTGIVKDVEEGFNDNADKLIAAKLDAITKEPVEKNKELAVFFTNSTNGYLESCDCPTHPYGGLVRRTFYLKSERAKYPENLAFDSGDLFSPYIQIRQADLVLKLIDRIGYDAVGIGDQEFSLDTFPKEIDKYKIPFLASNISYCNGGQCRQLTPKVFNFERAGLKISVLSVIDPDVFALYPEKITEHVTVIPLKDTIKSFISSQKGKSDLLVLISHCGFDADKVLAQDYPDIDLIIGGHSQTLVNPPFKSGKTIIVQAGENAQNVGKLILKIGQDKKIESYGCELIPLTKDVPDDPGARVLVNDFKSKARN